MAEYLVEWRIDIEADSVEEAARKALDIQRRPDSTATVFDVYRKGAREKPGLTPFRRIDLVSDHE